MRGGGEMRRLDHAQSPYSAKENEIGNAAKQVAIQINQMHSDTEKAIGSGMLYYF